MYPVEGELIEAKYRVERMLGEGGMGAVFRATHMLRRAPVALKFMSPMAAKLPEAVDRFMNEAVSASEIDSDHVVKIFDVGRFRDMPYLVMEFLEGCDLSHVIGQAVEHQQPISLDRALYLILQILRGLQVAHARGIIHRDLKPANAFVITKDGEPDFVKLLDFGISKKSNSDGGNISLTKTNQSMGTPLYMAPEQAKSARDADMRSDLYSVSAILYELLACRPPLEAETYNMILFKLFQEEPVSIDTYRPDLPPRFVATLHRGLSKDPSKRYQSAAEFGEALSPFASQRSQSLVQRLIAAAPGRMSMPMVQPTMMDGGALSKSAVSDNTRPQTASTAVAFAPTTGAGVQQTGGGSPGKSRAIGVVAGIAVAAMIGGGVVLGIQHMQSGPPGPTTATTSAKPTTTPVDTSHDDDPPTPKGKPTETAAAPATTPTTPTTGIAPGTSPTATSVVAKTTTTSPTSPKPLVTVKVSNDPTPPTTSPTPSTTKPSLNFPIAH